MSLASKLSSVVSSLQAIRTAIINKGQSVPSGTDLTDWPAKISAIETVINGQTIVSGVAAEDIAKGDAIYRELQISSDISRTDFPTLLVSNTAISRNGHFAVFKDGNSYVHRLGSALNLYKIDQNNRLDLKDSITPRATDTTSRPVAISADGKHVACLVHNTADFFECFVYEIIQETFSFVSSVIITPSSGFSSAINDFTMFSFSKFNNKTIYYGYAGVISRITNLTEVSIADLSRTSPVLGAGIPTLSYDETRICLINNNILRVLRTIDLSVVISVAVANTATSFDISEDGKLVLLYPRSTGASLHNKAFIITDTGYVELTGGVEIPLLPKLTSAMLFFPQVSENIFLTQEGVYSFNCITDPGLESLSFNKISTNSPYSFVLQNALKFDLDRIVGVQHVQNYHYPIKFNYPVLYSVIKKHNKNVDNLFLDIGYAPQAIAQSETGNMVSIARNTALYPTE